VAGAGGRKASLTRKAPRRRVAGNNRPRPNMMIVLVGWVKEDDIEETIYSG